MPFAPPIFTNMIFILCEIILTGFLEAQKRLIRQTKEQQRAEKITYILCIISICDYIKAMIAVYLYSESKLLVFPWLSNLIRPIELIVTIELLRNYMRRYLYAMKDTFFMVVLIFCYILYSAFIGSCMFAGTIEGSQYFSNLPESFWSLFVLITTANFPDVMLAAYHDTGFAWLFFVVYLFIGLFLMMNLFLATFYSSYQSVYEKDIDKGTERRDKHFSALFYKHAKARFGNDSNEELYLDREGVATIFEEVHSLFHIKVES